MKYIIFIFLFLSNILTASTYNPPFVQLGHPSSSVILLAATSNNKYIVSADVSGVLIVWDADTGKEILSFNNQSSPTVLLITPDDKYIVTGNTNGEIKFWDIRSGKQSCLLKDNNKRINALTITPDMKYLLSASSGGILRIWDIKRFKLLRTFKSHHHGDSVLKVTVDGKYGLTCGVDYRYSTKTSIDPSYSLKIWDIPTGKTIRFFNTGEGEIYVLAISKNGKYVLTGKMGLTLWDIKTGKKLRYYNLKKRIKAIHMMSDNKHVLLLFDGGNSIISLDLASGKQDILTKGYFDSLIATADDKKIVAGSNYGYLTVLEKGDDQKKAKWGSYVHYVNTIAVTKNGKYLASGEYSTPRLWDIESGKSIQTFPGHKKEITSIDINIDKHYLLTGSDDKTLKLWDIKTGKEIRSFKEKTLTSISNVSISPDGKYALASSARDLYLWNIETAKLKWHVKNVSKGYISTLKISADNKFIIGAGDDTLRTWDVETGKLTNKIKTNTDEIFISSVAVTSDEKYALTGFEPGGSATDKSKYVVLKLWDLQTGKLKLSFSGHKDDITSVTINNKYVLSGSRDTTVKLWNIETGEEIWTFNGHRGSIRSVLLDPKGHFAISSSSDGTVRLINIKTGKEVIQYLSFEDQGWISITKEGIFNGSKKAIEYVNIVKQLPESAVSENAISFHDSLYRPDLIKLKLAGNEVNYQECIKKIYNDLNITQNTMHTGVICQNIDFSTKKTENEYKITNKKWKRAILTVLPYISAIHVPVYESREKKKGQVLDSGPFYIRKVGDLWEIKKEAYPAIHGFTDLKDTMNTKESFVIDYITEDADYIDIFIFGIKREIVQVDGKSKKIPLYIIEYLEEVLRSNQKNNHHNIEIQLKKEDKVFLTRIAMRLKERGGALEQRLRYDRDIVIANKLLTYTKSALTINKILGYETCQYCYMNLATAYEFLDDRIEAIKYWKLAKWNQKIVENYIALGNKREAIPYLKLELEKGTKDTVTKGEPLYKIGEIFGHYDYYYSEFIQLLIEEEALDDALFYTKEYFSRFAIIEKQYLDPARKIENWSHLNDKALYFQAEIYSKQGKTNQALATLNQILNLYKKMHVGGDRPFKLFKKAADVYLNCHLYEASISYNIKALNKYGNTQSLYGKLAIYKKIVEAALKLQTKESDREIKKVIDTLNAIVDSQSKIKRYEMSFVLLEHTGDLLIKLGQYKKAALAYTLIKNNNWDNEGEGRAEFAPILLKLALIKKKEGDYRAALKYLNEALAETIKFYGDNNEKISKIYDQMSMLYLKTGEFYKAYEFATHSVNIYLKTKDKIFSIYNHKEKEKYLKSNRIKIDLLLKSTNMDFSELPKLKIKHLNKDLIFQHTFNTWINYKGSIFDSENMIGMIYESTKDKQLKEKIGYLLSNKRNLAKLYQTLPKPKEKEVWKNNIKNTEKQIAKLSKEIASKAENFKEQQGLKQIIYSDIATYLKKNELYIDYAKTGENYYIFTLDNNASISFTQINTDSTQKIESLVKAFRENIDSVLNDENLTKEKIEKLSFSSKKILSKLYILTVDKPLASILKSKKNLIISTDGLLRLLPFEAMYDKDKNKYMIEEKSVRYIPSGKELVRLYKYTKKKTEKNNTIIFANPDFNTKITKNKVQEKEKLLALTPNTSRAGIVKSLFKMRFAALPGTKMEAEAIKKTLSNENLTEYTQIEANEENLMQIKRPKRLHIATHGFFINDETIPNPMLRSGIALSGANKSVIRGKSNGVVTALKLSGLDLKGTDLVVLSACQTGVVENDSTENVSGLSKAFIQAGAKDIVMSLWSVNDEATKDLMSSFYKGIKKGEGYAESLRKAKLEMIEKGMHPFYWAPFILSGQ